MESVRGGVVAVAVDREELHSGSPRLHEPLQVAHRQGGVLAHHERVPFPAARLRFGRAHRLDPGGADLVDEGRCAEHEDAFGAGVGEVQGSGAAGVEDLGLLDVDADPGDVCSDVGGGTRGVVGHEEQAEATLSSSRHDFGGARHRGGSDVDDAVAVEHEVLMVVEEWHVGQSSQSTEEMSSRSMSPSRRAGTSLRVVWTEMFTSAGWSEPLVWWTREMRTSRRVCR